MIKRCTTCGEAHYFPRSICPFCFSDKTVREEVQRRGHGLHLQPDAEVADRSLRDRLCDAEGRSVAADQHRRLRSGEGEDRPEGEGGVEANRRRPAAVLHAGLELTPFSLVGEGAQRKGAG